MSRERKAAIRICRRAGYLVFRNYERSPKIVNARDFITRCYEVS